MSRKFTVVTLAQAGKELETLATKVAQLPDSASGRASLVAGLKTIRADIAALDSAAVHGDRAAAARVATQLAVATAQMDTLHDELDAKQKRAERK